VSDTDEMQICALRQPAAGRLLFELPGTFEHVRMCQLRDPASYASDGHRKLRELFENLGL
jgi:hypothetical protein